MILAIPARMRQALIGLRPGVLLGWAHQATRGELSSWNAQSCASRTGRTSGLPQIESYGHLAHVTASEHASMRRVENVIRSAPSPREGRQGWTSFLAREVCYATERQGKHPIRESEDHDG
jgi:hypothetical protein